MARGPAALEPPGWQLRVVPGPNNPVLQSLEEPMAGSELAGKRAAMVMSLIQSAKLRGHDPWQYLKEVLERLQGYPNHRID